MSGRGGRGFLEPEDFIGDDLAIRAAGGDDLRGRDDLRALQAHERLRRRLSALGHLRPDRLGDNREPAYVFELAEALRAAWKERTDAARAAGARSNHTTHLCAADAAGGLASLTFTRGP